MTTLATMRSRVALALGNKQGLNDTIDLNLNEATLQHTMRVKPKEMQKTATFSVSSATAAYNLSSNVGSDVYAVMFVRNTTDDDPLSQGTEREWHNSNQDTSQSSNLGKPHRWVHIEDDIVLFAQIPDSTSRTIQVRYLQRPATMTSAVDFPLNEEHERPVEQLAKALTWLDIGNETKAGASFNAYEALLTARFQPEEVEDEHGVFQVHPISNLDGAD